MNMESFFAYVLYLFLNIFALGGPFLIACLGVVWYRKSDISKQQSTRFLKYIFVIALLMCVGWFVHLSYNGTCFSMGGTIERSYNAWNCEDENAKHIDIPFNFLGYFFK